jgi:hypothetical protein
MRSSATTVREYLRTLPPDRRAAIGALRKTILAKLPKGYEEAVYLCNVYGSASLRKQLEASFKAAGKKLDMGKSCVRFKQLEDLPLDAIGRAVAATPMKDYVAFAKAMHSPEGKAARKQARAKR